MKVVLLDNIRGVGRMGEVKNVSDGYARNYLLPKKLARPAHSGLVNQIKDLEKKSAKVAAKEAETAKEIIELVSAEDFVLELQGKANREGSLYAAIGEKEIARGLKEKGVKVSPEDIKIEDPVKSVGDHSILLDFGDDLETKLKLRVQP